MDVYLPLANGRGFTRIDSADLHLFNGLTVHWKDGYASLRPFGDKKKVLVHRYIMQPMPDEFVDHIDMDRLNNCRRNLRIVSRTENALNRKVRSNAESGYKGVCRNRDGWVARIRLRGERFGLGTYATREEAARAYDVAALRLHGVFARTNFSPLALAA